MLRDLTKQAFVKISYKSLGSSDGYSEIKYISKNKKIISFYRSQSLLCNFMHAQKGVWGSSNNLFCSFITYLKYLSFCSVSYSKNIRNISWDRYQRFLFPFLLIWGVNFCVWPFQQYENLTNWASIQRGG